MRALVQRVIEATVTIDSSIAGRIGGGLLLFLGVHKADTTLDSEKMSRRVLQSRIFADGEGKMNCSLLDSGGELLVVSQFTLYGDTGKGNRPSYSDAAPAELANVLYEYFVACCRTTGVKVETGKFQANMQVYLVNDGPVTLMFDTKTQNVP